MRRSAPRRAARGRAAAGEPASCSANTSAGRAAMVPWIRNPAFCAHPVSALACASARSTKPSPAKKLPRTYCTARSTLGLSCGERILAASVTNPLACAYSSQPTVNCGFVASASATIAEALSGRAPGRRRRRTATPPHSRRRSPPASRRRSATHRHAPAPAATAAST